MAGFSRGDGCTLREIRDALRDTRDAAALKNRLLNQQNTLLKIIAREMICGNMEVPPQFRRAAEESVEITLVTRTGE